jgi:hypothetical protein
MKRFRYVVSIALPVAMLVAAPALADMKTRDRTQVHFEGMLGRKGRQGRRREFHSREGQPQGNLQ